MVLNEDGGLVAACEDFAAANEVLRRLGCGPVEALFANQDSTLPPTTVEDVRRGSEARAKARAGGGYPAFVANESLWCRSMQAVKTAGVAAGSDDYYPQVAACYRVAFAANDAAPSSVPAAFPTGSGPARAVEANFSQPMRGESGRQWLRMRRKKKPSVEATKL